MAPLPVTEDYYVVLEVSQTSTAEEIKSSYRRLALKLHPDRNSNDGSTQAFQLLAQAYETLGDATRRRNYDLVYPFWRQSSARRQSRQTTGQSPASAEGPEPLRESAEVAELQRRKVERGTIWSHKRQALEISISQLQQIIRLLEQDIKNLASIAAAEVLAEARKNSWGTWFLSPFYKQVYESDHEKARKDRDRQERRIEKDLKERRLGVQQAQLLEKESLFKQAKKDFDAANLRDDQMIRAIEARVREREARKRIEREIEERNRLARVREQQREQQEQQAREARDALRKQQAQTRAAQPACRHGGWWNKVKGRTACPECYDVWNYLLQCPGCERKACPKCQRCLRPNLSRNGANTNRTGSNGPRS